MVKSAFRFCLILLVAAAYPVFSLIDLNAKAQNFILETKQILIPEFPNAFNPSLTVWRNSLLLSFRIRDPNSAATNKIGLIWLDEKFNPIGEPHILIFPKNYPYTHTQDPRLITIGEDLFIVFNDMIKTKKGHYRRMFIGKVDFDGLCFYLNDPVSITQYDGEVGDRDEKNWVPFEFEGQLLLAYSILPHNILRPLLEGSHACESISSARSSIKWKWGELRGGTPALKIGDEYLAFFHSSKECATVQSQGKMITHYVMGAYTFSSKPPFEVTRISPEPIIGMDFYTGPAHNTWKPLRVVFPMGLVIAENDLWLSYGKQDFEMWVAKIDKKMLLESLVPVTTSQK